MIEWEYTENNSDGNIRVKLDGKIVGEIRKHDEGWRYHPKGGIIVGDAFLTRAECQQSLLND